MLRRDIDQRFYKAGDGYGGTSYDPWDPDEEEDGVKKSVAAVSANYDTREPFTGLNGVDFNYGAPGSPTEAINKQNPTGDPGRRYVDQGDTGGYLAGKGVTIGEGSSITPGERDQYLAAADAQGLGAYGQSFLGRNPRDYHRIGESYSNLSGNPNNPTGGAGGAFGSGAFGAGQDGLSSFLAYLQGRDQQEQRWRGSVRDMLMQQLQGLAAPLTADAPGIRDVLAGRRVASQRAAERAKAQAAERFASQGLGRSGALNTALGSIDQQRGEADTQGTGQVLYQELNNRRQLLQGLLQAALASGDASSAQAIQMQLAAIQTQIQSSQFNDNMGFQYNQLNANQNMPVLLWALDQMRRGGGG